MRSWRLIDEDAPKFRAVTPRGWIDRTNYRDLEFLAAFGAFEAQRGTR